jgi:hypothetical protein
MVTEITYKRNYFTLSSANKRKEKASIYEFASPRIKMMNDACVNVAISCQK